MKAPVHPKNSWKAIVLTATVSAVLALGVAVKLDWIEGIWAQKAAPTTPATPVPAAPAQAPAPVAPLAKYLAPGAPASFSDLALRVQSAVVNISTTKTLKLRRGPFYQFDEDYYRRYREPDSQALKKPNSLGSGFILNKDGYILTNHHVIDGSDEIQVKLADGRTFAARLAGDDPQTDLAVVKIDPDGSLPTVSLGDSDALQVGEWVIAIGNPFGLTQTVTAGILSAKGRVIGAGPYDNFLQTDASINPGNSGGPLFNLKGEVVGVNTAIIAGGQGIGFATPINIAKNIIPQLIQGGKVQRGFLGIGLQEVTPELAKKLGMTVPQGVLVGAVYEGSPAAQAGLKVGDVILKFSGRDISRSQDLSIDVSQSAIGSEAVLQVLREGKTQEFKVKLASLDQAKNLSSSTSADSVGSLGLSVRDLSAGEAQAQGLASGVGVFVTGVKPGSVADALGLSAGDVLLELNQRLLRGSKDFAAATQGLRKGMVARFFVQRGEMRSYFAVRI